MSESTQAVIAAVITITIGVAITAALYMLLNAVLWSWLAAILAIIASMFIETTAPVVAVKRAAFNVTVSGVTKLSSLLRRVAA